MRKMRFRISNDVDAGRTFSASIRGGCRGYDDAMAIEAHSNDVCPTVKTLTGFTVIVEVDNDN